MSIIENSDDIEHFISRNIWGKKSIDFHFRQKTQTNRSDVGLSGYSICQDQFIKLKYAQIQTIIDNVARQLLFSGLKTGDILALQLPNSIESQILYLACWQQGMVVAPLPTLWREHDIKQALIRISPQAFISPILHDGFNYSELMYQIGFDISSLRLLFSIGGGNVDGCIALDEYFNAQVTNDLIVLKPDDYRAVDADSPCLITFSKDVKGSNTPFYHTHNQLIAAANIFNSLAKPSIGNNISNPFPPTSIATCATTIVSWALTEAALVCFDGLMATEFQNIETNKAILLLPAAFDEPNLVSALFNQGLSKLILINKIHAKSAQVTPNENIIDITTFNEYAFIPCLRTSQTNQIECKNHSYALLDGETKDNIILSEYVNAAEQSVWQISCSFLPTNTAKVNNRTNTDIIVNVNTGNESNVTVGNMLVNFADIELELLNYHGVEDAAILVFDDKLLGQKPVLAIVPKVGSVILHHEIVEFLKNKLIATHKIPLELYKIPDIPRDQFGNIVRHTSKQELLKLVGPTNNNIQVDDLLSVQNQLANLIAEAK